MASLRFLVTALRTPAFDPAVLAPHRAFLDALRTRGALELAGPFADRSGGAYLLRADSLAQARAIVAADPLAASGGALIEVREWSAA